MNKNQWSVKEGRSQVTRLQRASLLRICIYLQATQDTQECKVQTCQPKCPKVELAFAKKDTFISGNFSIAQPDSDVLKYEVELDPMQDETKPKVEKTANPLEFHAPNLLRNHGYIPKIKILFKVETRQEGYSKYAQLMKTCNLNPFKTIFWYCNDKTTIGAHQVCDGKEHCADASDEDPLLCKGDHSNTRYWLLGTISAHVTIGFVCVLIMMRSE